VLPAQTLLEKYNVAADVWSVTSYQELYRDGTPAIAGTCCIPGETPRVSYVAQCLNDAPGVLVAASDYLKVLARLDRSVDAAAHAVARYRWVRPQRGSASGSAISSRSTRASSRSATLAELAQDGQLDRKVVAQAIKDLDITPEK
jgi:pyruvate dehydrogenase E1 component